MKGSCSSSRRARRKRSTSFSEGIARRFTVFSAAAWPIRRAEELAQETFLALMRGARRYEPRALFRTYLYAIALKILRSERRKAAFRAMFFGVTRRAAEPQVNGAAEAGIWVRRALAKLEAIDREMLMLREFEQLSYAEIADLLQIPVNTVRSRLFRARMALRELLEAPAAQRAAQPTVQPVPGMGEQV